MMKRRHQIAHESDLNLQTVELNRIEIEEIVDWFEKISSFCTDVLRLIINDVYLDEIMARVKSAGLSIDKKDLVDIFIIEIESK